MSDPRRHPLRIGISASLPADNVRFDAGHTRDDLLVGALSPFVEWVPVCPDLESGLDVLTDLCGFVLRHDGASAVPKKSGRGVFGESLVARFPSLPVEEEGRLNDARLCENFVERVCTYRRVTELFDGRWTTGQLVAFHTAHKLTLMAHSPSAYQRLGRLVAGSATRPRRALADEYQRELMGALRVVATRGRHVNVLQHMLGYFKTSLDADGRGELLTSIERYAAGTIPLAAPLTLFTHHVRRLDVRYLAGQVYLDPHPAELMLRLHV